MICTITIFFANFFNRKKSLNFKNEKIVKFEFSIYDYSLIGQYEIMLAIISERKLMFTLYAVTRPSIVCTL